jgi:hypothetical protein
VFQRSLRVGLDRRDFEGVFDPRGDGFHGSLDRMLVLRPARSPWVVPDATQQHAQRHAQLKS